MSTLEINNLVLQSITRLNEHQQLKLLEFVNAMLSKMEFKANHLLKFAGTIDKDDLTLMKHAIAAGCEKVDYNEW